MAVAVKNSSPKAFSVPSLAEVDKEYAELSERLIAVRNEAAVTGRDVEALLADLRKSPPSHAVRDGLAELIGDVTVLDDRPQKLAALRARQRDLEDATEILSRRLADRRGPASRLACERVRSEYGNRIKAVCEALRAANEAHRQLDAFIDALEERDIQWLQLGVHRPVFLGDSRTGSGGHVERFLKDATEAKYV